MEGCSHTGLIRKEDNLVKENAPNEVCPIVRQFDPFAQDYLADPMAVFAALAATPIFYAPSIDYYVVTTYEDIETVFRDHESYSAAPAQLPLVDIVPEAQAILLDAGYNLQPSMASLDPPAHTRVRGHTARAFTAKRISQMEPAIRTTTRELLDAVRDAPSWDVVRSLSFPLPATTIFNLLGVPNADVPKLREWGSLRAGLTFGRPGPVEQVEMAKALAAYRNYLREFAHSRLGTHSDDFTSDLLEIHEENPEGLDFEEVVSVLFTLSFAGHETTKNLISNSVRRFLEARARWMTLVADPSLIQSGIEEVLRYDPSVAVWRRAATRPVEIGEVMLPAGAKLFLWLAAAGRDPTVFDDPHVFDLQRHNARRHLAFGKGIHACLGANLARLETRIAIEELTASFPDLGITPGQALEFPSNITARGPLELWVERGCA